MALFTQSQLRQYVASYKRSSPSLATKSAQEILKERTQIVPFGTKFDIFLSHSIKDAELVLGITLALQDMGYTSYVDWVVDAHLSRSEVSKETADVLRKRMEDCKCLFFSSTENTTESKWMPWETGYFDAKKEKVAILPISTYGQADDKYEGQEYLGLYPYVSVNKSGDRTILFINENPITYVAFHQWLRGEKPTKRQS